MMAEQLKTVADFARSLVNNEQINRDNTLNMLKKFIPKISYNTGFTLEDLLKLWKGLFYCMYNADKALYQEQLAEKLSSFVHDFATAHQMFLYFEAAVITFNREWDELDHIRIEKYMQLFIRIFRQILISLKDENWDVEITQAFCNVLEKRIIFPSGKDKENSCCGDLQCLLLDIFLEEIAKVSTGEVSHEVLMCFIRPFIKVLAQCNDQNYLRAVKEDIFQKLIQQSDAFLDHGKKDSDEEYEEISEDDEEMGEDDEMGEDGGSEEEEIQYGGMTDDDEDEHEDKVFDPRAGGVNVPVPQLLPNYAAIAKVLFKVRCSKSSSMSQRRRKQMDTIILWLTNVSWGRYPYDEYNRMEAPINSKNLERNSVKSHFKIQKAIQHEKKEFKQDLKKVASIRKLEPQSKKLKKKMKTKLKSKSLSENTVMGFTVTQVDNNRNDPKSVSKKSSLIESQFNITKIKNRVSDDAPVMSTNGHTKSHDIIQEKNCSSKGKRKSDIHNKIESGLVLKIKHKQNSTIPTEGKKNEFTTGKKKAKRKDSCSEQRQDTETTSKTKKSNCIKEVTRNYTKDLKSKFVKNENKLYTTNALTNGSLEPESTNVLNGFVMPKKRRGITVSLKKTPIKLSVQNKALKINLQKNMEHSYNDYRRDLQLSPAIPFSANRKPSYSSILKPSPSPIRIRKGFLSAIRSQSENKTNEGFKVTKMATVNGEQNYVLRKNINKQLTMNFVS